jgi:hypothetical protein
MISIIICSREQTISFDLYENIKDTIGCEYELIVIDNSKNKYSIFEAYNLGIEKSKGKYLCFIHDDIFIHTKGWGNNLHRIFNEDSKIGLIGVAGAKVKTKMPSAWWDCTDEQKVINIIQHFKNKEKEELFMGFEDASDTEVVVIDGVFMAMRRDIRFIFDLRLKGFHNYDLYISLKHHMFNKKVLVTSKILLEHFSEGSLNKAWYESTSLFHKLYKNYLPVDVNGEYKNEHLKKTEFEYGKTFITRLVQHKLYWDAIYWWFEIFKLKPKSKYHFRFWKSILINFLNLKNG